MTDTGQQDSRGDEATYRAVFDRVADALIIHAKDDHRILDANPAALKRLGYTLEELRRMTPLDLHPPAELDLVRSRIGRRNPELANTYVHLTKSGLEVPVEILSEEIVYKGIPAWLSIARDIRERKAWGEMVAAARDEAVEASNHKSKFIAHISHELRTPMNGLLGMTSMLLDTHLDEQQREYADTVQQAANSMLELLNEILDLSKIESGKLELEAVHFDLRQILEGIQRMLRARAIESGVELIVELPPRLRNRLLGDPMRLRQVLLNLAANALKFTHKGHVAIRVRDLGRDGSDQLLGFRVEDTGIGIPKDQLPHIFEEFHQGDGTTSRRFGGTGLGLTISRRLVQLMGGELRVRSVEAQGSVFSFELKLPVYAAMLEPGPAVVATQGDALVVHADAARREQLAGELDRMGLRVFTAATASKALSLLEGELTSSRLRLAIVDYLLPDIDGETFAHSLVRRNVIPRGSVALERPEGIQLDLRRLNERGIGVFFGRLGSHELAQLGRQLADSMPADSEAAAVALPARGLAGREPDPASFGNRRARANFDVLVVEDNPVNQRVITQLLGKLGCSVDVAEHGLRALEFVRSKRYAIIFMDCQMPEMDGYVATAEIRRLDHPASDTPIVALTANAMDGDREKCLNCGMDDYLSKPATTKQIDAMLTKWAERSATPVD